MDRKVTASRKTSETSIELALDLSTPGVVSVSSGVPFLDHLLTSFAFHGGFSLSLRARGDTAVDAHHLVEDLGLVLGGALKQSVTTHGRVARFGSALIPMDEALAEVALDVCGRATAVLDLPFPQPRVGDFDLCLLREFLTALAARAEASLHATLRAGQNSHHMAEALFKALGRAVSQAYAHVGGDVADMSTKGTVSFS